MRAGDLSRFLGAISAAYPEDGTRPGIVMADMGNKPSVPKKSRFYCSAKRYQRGLPGQVIVSAYGATADKALAACREEFVKLWAPLVNEVRRPR